MEAERMLTKLKVQVTVMAMGNLASRLRTLIVCEDLWQLMKKEENCQGKIGVSGTKGNLHLRYEFDVLSHPDFDKLPISDGFFFVPHRAALYSERYLGRELDYLGEAGNGKRRSEDGVEEVNPITGYLKAGNSFFSNMPFEDALELKKADPNVNWFSAVLNQPEIHWVGSIKAYRERLGFDRVFGSCQPFLWYYGPKPTRGQLYMKKWRHGWIVAARAVDGFGVEREFVFGKPTNNRREFAQYALQYFRPEEVWLAFQYHKPYDTFDSEPSVEELTAMSKPPNWLNRGMDPERTGRLEKWKDVHACVVDTAGLQWYLPVAGKAEELFPDDWSGWPMTRNDRNMASILLKM
jgi:hypothetical protein